MRLCQFYTVVIICLTTCLSACNNSNNGKYSFKAKSSILYIILQEDNFTIREEDIKDGKMFVHNEVKAKFHINESNAIILDKMISGKDSIMFQKAFNAVKVVLKGDSILFYEDFDRNDDLWIFSKE